KDKNVDVSLHDPRSPLFTAPGPERGKVFRGRFAVAPRPIRMVHNAVTAVEGPVLHSIAYLLVERPRFVTVLTAETLNEDAFMSERGVIVVHEIFRLQFPVTEVFVLRNSRADFNYALGRMIDNFVNIACDRTQIVFQAVAFSAQARKNKPAIA